MTDREALAVWVGREILPHERDLRRWLLHSIVRSDDVEDIVQECYCRLAEIEDCTRIAAPRAYLFVMARNIALKQMRRSRVVRIDALTEMELLTLESEAPSPERVVAGRLELSRVRRLIATLPERCRRIVEMRKIDGLSQREVAHQLGVTEAVVENEASRGLRAILRQLAGAEDHQPVRRDERRHVR